MRGRRQYVISTKEGKILHEMVFYGGVALNGEFKGWTKSDVTKHAWGNGCLFMTIKAWCFRFEPDLLK